MATVHTVKDEDDELIKQEAFCNEKCWKKNQRREGADLTIGWHNVAHFEDPPPGITSCAECCNKLARHNE